MSIHREQLLCPILVGREAELAVLRAALDSAMHGHVRGIFVSGEAGIGKSRLCRALFAEAREYGLAPLLGLGSPQETMLPYGLIVNALRRALEDTPPNSPALREALAPVLPVVAPLLPELGASTREMPYDLPAMLRRRLFDGLIQALHIVAGRRAVVATSAVPLVLVLEDLHWADESTLDLVEFLLRSASSLDPDQATSSGRGVLLIGTFRGESLPDAPALSRTVSTLLAARLARQIELPPLQPAQMTTLLDAALGQPLPPELADAIVERSEGNPFIAEELLGTLAAAGHLTGSEHRQPWEMAAEATLHLPLSLRSAVLERLALLPASARTLLSAAAVAGRTFDFDLLAAVTALDGDDLLAGLRLSLRGGLIAEDPTDPISGSSRYRFRHALVREVIYGELLGPERRALHAAVARVLEEDLGRADGEGTEGERVVALAYHYRLAGDRSKALAFTLRAAERSRALLAFAEARRHYAEALTYHAPLDPARLPLLEALGLLSLALLDVRGAVAHFEEATALLRRLGLTRKAAGVAGEMHHLLWYVDLARFRDMVEELDRLAEAVRSGADGAGPEDADALALYSATALAHAVYAAYSRAALWAQRALDLAELLVQRGALTRGEAALATYKALLARGHARLHGKVGGNGELETAEAGLRDEYATLELGLREGRPEVVQLAYNFVPRGLLEIGRDAEAMALIDAADAYAQRSGVAAIADSRGYGLLVAGRWDEGVAVMRAAIAGSRALDAPAKLALELTALGHLLVAQGDAHGAIAALEEALAILEPGGQFVLLAPCLGGLAHARALLGDDEAAAALFARGRDLWRATQDRGTVVPLLLEGCLFHAHRGEVRLAQEWAGDLVRVAGDQPVPAAAAATGHARGTAARVAGDYDAAVHLLQDAVEGWTALARPYEAARAGVELATAILAAAPRDQARRSAADTALLAAMETFRRLGAGRDVDDVEDMRRRAGLQAQARRKQTLSAKRAPFGDLTPREHEVLLLLVAGHTNREIAQALFIAEGTVELHVSRILSKLGCATRAQAGVYAVAHGLVEAPAAD